MGHPESQSHRQFAPNLVTTSSNFLSFIDAAAESQRLGDTASYIRVVAPS